MECSTVAVSGLANVLQAKLVAGPSEIGAKVEVFATKLEETSS